MQTRCATAVSSPNIAFIKYWGNRNDSLRLPANGSISMNLAGLETRTSVELSPQCTEDEFILQGIRQRGIPLARVSNHLNLLRAVAGSSCKARIDSSNNFPLGAGIASSASAFAALTVAAVSALGLTLSQRDLSVLARRGSGSASRSIPDGFVEWFAADRNEESYAESIAAPFDWELVDLIAILDSTPKKVGSAEGNMLARTSPLQETRVADAPRRLEICRRAIREKDFLSLAAILEEDTRLMHEVMETSTPALHYRIPSTLGLMDSILHWRADGLAVAYTIDAGPNVHCICLEAASGEVEKRLREIPEVRQLLRAQPGMGARVVAG